jgi:hypothetical protein
MSEKTHEDENYHLHIDKKMKAGSHVPRKSDHRQHRTKSQSQKGKKGETSPTFLDDDLNFTDTVLMGLDSMDADLKIGLMMSRIRSISTCDSPRQWNLLVSRILRV